MSAGDRLESVRITAYLPHESQTPPTNGRYRPQVWQVPLNGSRSFAHRPLYQNLDHVENENDKNILTKTVSICLSVSCGCWGADAAWRAITVPVSEEGAKHKDRHNARNPSLRVRTTNSDGVQCEFWCLLVKRGFIVAMRSFSPCSFNNYWGKQIYYPDCPNSQEIFVGGRNCGSTLPIDKVKGTVDMTGLALEN